MITISLIAFSLSDVISSSNSDINNDYVPVISEDLPVNISGDFELVSTSTKVAHNTNKSNKQSSKVHNTHTICYTHVLEQQGSPNARTVRVCEKV
jgi:hypothetical protein